MRKVNWHFFGRIFIYLILIIAAIICAWVMIFIAIGWGII